MVFQRMLLGGTLGGVRILDGATVDAAFTNQIGDLRHPPSVATVHPELSADVSPGPGLK